METTVFSHKPVLLRECIEGLHIRPGFTYVDCTTGGGGHSYEIARRLSGDARLICLDRDTDALSAAKTRLKDFSDKITFVHTNFSDLGEILDKLQVNNLGGVLADLGCSSYQFDTPERGFSYMHDAPLDMRMDTDSGLTAYDVVNTYGEDELQRILYEYGEEKFAPKIAKEIARSREIAPIRTTFELANLIKKTLPAAAKIGGPHPAKRSFQAIRIEVNHELDAISPALKAAAERMVTGGRIAVISFHSLEDRCVKNTFADLARGCTCPRDFPVCVCGRKPIVNLITRKPILPSEEELEENPRARSAKLRIAEKR